MKFKIRNIIIAAAYAGLLLTGCKKEDFIDDNINPETLYDVPPANQFLNATISIHNTDFEWYYDLYRRIMPWMQMSTATNGNGKTFIEDAGNFNQRYGNFYVNVGNKLVDANRLIDNLPAEEQPKYMNMKAINNILLAYYGFYVSDINGSIPFTEAFQARYGGTLTPKYDTQEELFNTFDAMLKESIGVLKTAHTVSQQSLGSYDLYYNGNPENWVKAANALRLRLAMRYMKRDPNKMKTIATEVLSSPANELMSSNADSWVLDVKASFASGGNWSPEGFRAPKATVDFMLEKDDPRVRLFYQKNKWGQYVGSVASPDAAESAQYSRLYTTTDTLSNLQYRLFQASYNGGTGINYFPVITFADFAFMRAELAARGVVGDNAEQWYNTGVTASIKQYDQWAKDANIQERDANGNWVNAYVPVTDAEIANYLSQPEVKYTPAIALEQIAVQAYLNFFKQPNEAWALYKRTGYPNSSTVLAFERILADGVEQFPPRRAPISIQAPTDLNYANNQAAIAEMSKDPGFGQGPSDVFGRVWWDKN